MGLLLRCSLLCHRTLLKQEIRSLKYLVTHSVSNRNVKKFSSTLQLMSFSSKKNEKSDTELVYIGAMSKKIRNARLFSLIATGILVVLEPFTFKEVLSQNLSLSNIIILLLLVNGFCWLSPLIVHIMTKNYAVKLYYNVKEKNYTITQYKFFLKEKKIMFKPEELKPHVKSEFFSNCTINGLKMLLDENGFIDVKHYYALMDQRKLKDFERENIVVRSINQPQIPQTKPYQIEDKRLKE